MSRETTVARPVRLNGALHYVELQLGSNQKTKTAPMCPIWAMYGVEYGTQRYKRLGLKFEGLGRTTQLNIKGL